MPITYPKTLEAFVYQEPPQKYLSVAQYGREFVQQQLFEAARASAADLSAAPSSSVPPPAVVESVPAPAPDSAPPAVAQAPPLKKKKKRGQPKKVSADLLDLPESNAP